VVQYERLGLTGWIVVVILLALLGRAIWQSKRPAPEFRSAEQAADRTLGPLKP